MPGLTGVVGPLSSHGLLDAMVESMRHESFYVEHQYTDEHVPFAVARIGPNAPNPEPQPIWNEDRTVLGMMEGEVHEAGELERELVQRGHKLSVGNHLDLLLHLYEEEGGAFLDNVKGQFVVFVYDTRDGTAWIGTDRFGFQPLFYAEAGDSLLFSGELKALLKEPSVDRTLDDGSLGDLLRYETVLGGNTPFRAIKRVPPASIWCIKNGKLDKNRYWNRDALLDTRDLSRSDYIDRAESTLKTAVADACIGGDIGVSITGGWDTRAIMALIDHDNVSAPCFTLTGPSRLCVDARIGAKVAAACGQQHHPIVIGDEFFSDFPKEAERTVYISDWAARIDRTHELLLNRTARDFGTYRVAGTHASQVVRGVSLLRNRLPDTRFFSSEYQADLDQTAKEGIGVFLGDVVKGKYTNREMLLFLLEEEIREGARAGNRALELSQIWNRTPYTNEDFVSVMFQSPGCFQGAGIRTRHLHRSTGDRIKANLKALLAATNTASWLQSTVIERNRPSLAQIPVNLGEEPYDWSGLKGIAWKLWSRPVGALDKFHNSFEYPGFMRQIDRFIQASRLQNTFLGFNHYISYRLWMMKELKEWVREILLDSRTLNRGYFDKRFLEQSVTEHVTGKRCHTDALTTFLSFELGFRLFVD